MKNVIRALICCVLAVTISLVGYGNMPSASADSPEVVTNYNTCNPGGGIIIIPPDQEVTLCPGTFYQFMGTDRLTQLTFTNTSAYYNAEILFAWGAQNNRTFFILAGFNPQTYSQIFGPVTVTVANNSLNAPVKLKIRTI